MTPFSSQSVIPIWRYMVVMVLRLQHHPSTSLLDPELHVLIRRPDRHRDQVDRMIGHPRPDANHHSRVPDWREHHSIDRELLDPVEESFPLRGIPFAGLLLEQFVDVGISAVG